MFGTKLEELLIKALNNLLFSKEFISEDDFRDQLSTELKRIISNAYVSIPSTRSARGDIDVLGKKCEIKYLRQDQKQKTKVKDIIDDLESLREKKCDFVIIAFHMNKKTYENFFLNDIISFPSIKIFSENEVMQLGEELHIEYKAYSIFFGGAYLTDFVESNDKAKKAPKYLKFENCFNIRRKVFIEVKDGEYLCSSIIGSCEDGFIFYLYSNAKNIKLSENSKRDEHRLEYFYNERNYFFADEYICDFESKKDPLSKNLIYPEYKILNSIVYKIFKEKEKK